MLVTPRLRPIIVGWTILLILFLVALAFQLSIMQRDAEVHGVAGLQPTASVLTKVLGGLLLLVPAFWLFARFVRPSPESRAEASSEDTPGVAGDRTEVIINAFHEVVQRLREKEQELVRLRTEAEARAQEIESYNEDILRSVTSGVITFNQDGTITTFNEAAARILRMAAPMVIGKTCGEVFGPDSQVMALLKRSQQRGEIINREEFELFQEDRRRIWVGVSTSLLRDRGGHLIGTTFVFTDLTEVKDLQSRVELRERMTVLGEMSAGIAHEFRNFMGTILGAAKLIGRQAGPSEPVQESLGTIFQVISDMDHLITQFLNFSKKTELDIKSVVVDSWLKRVVEQVPMSGTPSPSVQILCGPNLPSIAIDEVLMRQALGNLIQNAFEAMPRGGTLAVAASLVGSTGARRHLELRITDTGCGIPTDRLEKIFLPFYTTKTKGTGLGLALVHKIVLLHNGRIQVDSEEGKGATFRILLPVEGTA
jgi:PAS domain S-box-containing protein